jgi:hypothetical protein
MNRDDEEGYCKAIRDYAEIVDDLRGRLWKIHELIKDGAPLGSNVYFEIRDKLSILP